LIRAPIMKHIIVFNVLIFCGVGHVSALSGCTDSGQASSLTPKSPEIPQADHSGGPLGDEQRGEGANAGLSGRTQGADAGRASGETPATIPPAMGNVVNNVLPAPLPPRMTEMVLTITDDDSLVNVFEIKNISGGTPLPILWKNGVQVIRNICDPNGDTVISVRMRSRRGIGDTDIIPGQATAPINQKGSTEVVMSVVPDGRERATVSFECLGSNSIKVVR
jgi:hypothetical protein